MVKILGHRILVKVHDITETDDTYKRAADAKIIIPKGDELLREQAAVDRGIIVQIGETAYKDLGYGAWISVGDEVMFSKYSGKRIEDPYTKEVFTAINDEDVVVVLKKDEE